MSFFNEIFSSSNQSVDTVNVGAGASVLSATGLSRKALAELFRQDGLYGHDSDLSPVEQAIVQSRLGYIPGLKARPVLAPTDARLVALENFTDALVQAGGVAQARDEAQLVAAGYSQAATSEVVRVVRLARDVFGLVAQPRRAAIAARQPAALTYNA
ncbi:hypothetical protein DFR24_2988 [Panacagrimonas perspica]|uniref:Uncharacterized protein n=1 Tax=Panacagrimonas perspica TaxID=381431 RepID=A0A4S3K9H0_9GAMM|nr:hypothetical protein [Panacagrimonas perspica]TDU28613.1 hypothetical protein DFR24_2988 [Panacagrimonas perspica]THD04945.1 hypothetical protein B1810_03080 [Panacagrimonas perspica]